MLTKASQSSLGEIKESIQSFQKSMMLNFSVMTLQIESLYDNLEKFQCDITSILGAMCKALCSEEHVKNSHDAWLIDLGAS